MIALILVFTLVCVGFEIMLVNKIPGLLPLLERFPLAALVFSLILSVALGALFGAAGLTVFVAGLVSTFLVQPYYRLKKRGVLDDVRAQVDGVKANLASKKDVYVRRTHQLIRGFVLVWKIITFPFVVIGMIMDRADVMSGWIKERRS